MQSPLILKSWLVYRQTYEQHRQGCTAQKGMRSHGHKAHLQVTGRNKVDDFISKLFWQHCVRSDMIYNAAVKVHLPQPDDSHSLL